MHLLADLIVQKVKKIHYNYSYSDEDVLIFGPKLTQLP